MTGNNTLYINKASAIEAFECWLATQMVTPVKVTAVTASSGRNNYGEGFEVVFAPVEPVVQQGGQDD